MMLSELQVEVEEGDGSEIERLFRRKILEADEFDMVR